MYKEESSENCLNTKATSSSCHDPRDRKVSPKNSLSVKKPLAENRVTLNMNTPDRKHPAAQQCCERKKL